MLRQKTIRITILALLVFIGGLIVGDTIAEALGMTAPLTLETVKATVVDRQTVKYLKRKILSRQ
ncbi:MAG: hypothetical protein IJZ10_02295 [Thermoguttaceae bacterium]|nr:hypothetical protein [Thermoguttaceae bacterium]